MKPTFIKMEEARLPSEDIVIEGIRIIEATSFENLSYQVIKKVFMDAFGMVPGLFRYSDSFDTPIYRVTDGQYNGFDETKISSYSHPPADKCKKGRANIGGSPIFYASLSADTALREFRKSNGEKLQEGDTVYISSWTTKKTKLLYAEFLFSDSVKLGDQLIGLNNSNHEKINELSLTYPLQKGNAFKLLLEGLSSLFIGDEAYMISSFLAHHFLYDNREDFPYHTEILLYPSVQADLNGFNFAIHPDFVETQLQLRDVRKAIFKSFNQGSSRLSLKEIGRIGLNKTVLWLHTCFDLSSIQVNLCYVQWKNGGPSEKITEKTLFASHKFSGNFTLSELALKYLGFYLKDALNELSKFEEDLEEEDFDKLYSRVLVFPSEGEVLIDKNNHYEVDQIVAGIDYKMSLLPKKSS